MLSEKGSQVPQLTPNEQARVNEVLQWARKHELCLSFTVLGTVPRLMEMVYVSTGHVAVTLRDELLRRLANLSPPAANTRSATPRKGKAQDASKGKAVVVDKGKAVAVDKGKAVAVDKGKGILVEPEKPEKVVYPIQTGGVFRIQEPRAPAILVLPIVPLVVKSPMVPRRKVGSPPKAVRALVLADKEDELEVEEPATATFAPTPPVRASAEESDIQVVEASVVKKRKLTKETEPTVPMVEPTAPLIGTAVPPIQTVNVAYFLVAQRSQALPPSVPRAEEVAAFLANEPVLAVPMNVVRHGPLQALGGPIPSMLDHPLGSNIQHILEGIEVESEDSVGMTDDNLGPSTAAAMPTPQQPLSTILEQEASSRAPTPKRPRSPTLNEGERASVSKRP
jgi:hypothetical protein